MYNARDMNRKEIQTTGFDKTKEIANQKGRIGKRSFVRGGVNSEWKNKVKCHDSFLLICKTFFIESQLRIGLKVNSMS